MCQRLSRLIEKDMLRRVTIANVRERFASGLCPQGAATDLLPLPWIRTEDRSRSGEGQRSRSMIRVWATPSARARVLYKSKTA